MTPMMKQYQKMKKLHPEAILFFRMGDFYEMFFEDAQTASRVLGLTLTARDKGTSAIPMAGVPHHSADGYIRKLISAGFKVAVCDQVQDPKEAKGLVDRDVTRVITPGTLTDDPLLDAKQPNFLAAVCPGPGTMGLAWADLSTGKFFVQDVPGGEADAGLTELLNALARVSPAECLVPENLYRSEDPFIVQLRAAGPGMITPRADWIFDRETSDRALREHFQVATLEGFGCARLQSGIGAAGAVLDYLKETQKASLAHITRLQAFHREDFAILDRTTQVSLELVEQMRTKDRRGTLLWVLDQTVTPMGARLLREWVLSPLRQAAAINHRLDGVEALVKDALRREEVRDQLKPVADLERISARISCGRANPRDLAAVAPSARALPAMREQLAETSAAMLKDIRERIDPLDDLAARIEAVLVAAPPTGIKDGGIIRPGHHAELDELRRLRSEGKAWIQEFRRREAKRTGIETLKVGFNNVFGYYIEVTHANAGKVPADYQRKQTLKNAERYITPELKEYESKVLHADERAKEIEQRLFLELRDELAQQAPRIQATARALAELDLLANLAQVAAEHRYCRPQVDDGRQLVMVDSRHPVVEQTLEEESFVPNDLGLDGQEEQIVILTGPNMAGKSTYIRQVALIVLMAQMGSFVPAKRAHLGAVDRLFTRVGASDELARGQSTFMVEMIEAANILNHATDRSLIILDEVGRGTSTFDGVSIAWAVTEYIHEHLHARTLFATHYHELTELPLVVPTAKNYNVAVQEWGDEVVFLRKIIPGGTDKSYGIHVARLAGIPKEVIERAKVILVNLEAETLDPDNLPKFAPSKARAKKSGLAQLSLFSSPHQPTIEKLKQLEPEKLTPLEALQKLHELKGEVKERERKA